MLTQIQKKVLALLRSGYTIRQIAHRRKTTTQAVYRIVKRLEVAGWVARVGEIPHPTNAASKPVRLHGQQFKIKILYQDKRYALYCRDSNILHFESSTVSLHRKAVIIYGKKDFIAHDPAAALKVSIDYWVPFFKRLEAKLGVILIKHGYENIKQVAAHYAQVDNELAHKSLDENKKLRLKAEDGKTWLEADNSFNLRELETLHPETGYTDMAEVIGPFFDAIRQKPRLLDDIKAILYTNSSQINQSLELAKINAEQLGQIIKIMGLSQQPTTGQPKDQKTIASYIG